MLIPPPSGLPPQGAGGPPSGMIPPGMPPMGVPPMPQAPPPPAMLHDVKIVTRKTYKCARVEGLPPEEFGISRMAKSMRDCKYCFHYRPYRTADDLIADGFDAKQVNRLATSPPSPNLETLARDTIDESTRIGSSESRKGIRPIATTEHYIEVDYEENGSPKIYRVTTANETEEILNREGKPAIEAVDMMPFAAMTPIPVTHRFYGKSIADCVMDIQRIKTSLLRAVLDNTYLANNQRTEIAESHAGKNTIDDLLTNRPGGIVRTKAPGGLIPIPNNPIGAFVFPMIEYMDAMRDRRTGVNKQAMGLDADTLQNQSATAASQVFRAAEAQLKLVARIFAETGIRDLFMLLHATIRKNDRESNTVRLRNKWVTVDPRNWKTRTDMTINVGLGSGSKLEQRAAIGQVLAAQKEAMLAPQLGLVKPKNIYNSLKKLVELSGLKSADAYFVDPDQNPLPPQPPAPDPNMIKVQGQLAIEDKQAQSDMAVQEVKAQTDIAVAQAKTSLQTHTALLNAGLKMRESNSRMEQAAVGQATARADRQAQQGVLPTSNKP